jgi:hypothetical protein
MKKIPEKCVIDCIEIEMNEESLDITIADPHHEGWTVLTMTEVVELKNKLEECIEWYNEKST